jgi:HSP20 family protein
MADKEIMESTQDTRRQIRPLYSIVENRGEVILTIEMPGVKKDDLSISIENSELRVAGKRSENDPNGRYLVRERRQGDFVNSFTLDDTIDQNKVDASLDNGLLTVKLHVKEEVKPKRIEIKTS